MARLLAEEEEAAECASTPPLPASRLLRRLEEGSGRLRPPGRRQNFLWEGSALTGAWALESFYTESLVPTLVPPRPAEVRSRLALTRSPSGGGLAGEEWRLGDGNLRFHWRGKKRGCHLACPLQLDGSPGKNREARWLPMYVLLESLFKMQRPRSCSQGSHCLPAAGPGHQAGLTWVVRNQYSPARSNFDHTGGTLLQTWRPQTCPLS